MFLRQLQLIVSALTCSLSAICAFLYQLPLLKFISILGLLWSFYACYKLFKFDTRRPLKTSNKEKDPEIGIVSQIEPEIFLRNQDAPNNINEEPTLTLKKEPKISKSQKWISKT